MGSVLDLTIAIPVKNEGQNIAACLKSIGSGFAEKVLLIDSGSMDETKSIAESFGVEVINFEWNGMFPKKRNWLLREHTPYTKWILFLDADEHLTENFKAELRIAIEDNTKSGFQLTYTRYFLGKELKGGYPLRKLALFKVGAGEYEYIDEDNWSKLDMEIHEHPILTGNIGVIKSKIEHRDFRGITHYLAKHSEYANWEASRFIKIAKDYSNTANWSWRQRLKYRLMGSIWIGPVYFIGNFFLFGGFKDGVRGLAFGILKMCYFTQVYCKILELNGRR